MIKMGILRWIMDKFKVGDVCRVVRRKTSIGGSDSGSPLTDTFTIKEISGNNIYWPVEKGPNNFQGAYECQLELKRPNWRKILNG